MNQCEFKIMLILGLLDVATETRTCDCSNVTCESVTLERNSKNNSGAIQFLVNFYPEFNQSIFKLKLNFAIDEQHVQ